MMYFAHCELAFSMLTAWSEVTQGNRTDYSSLASTSFAEMKWKKLKTVDSGL